MAKSLIPLLLGLTLGASGPASALQDPTAPPLAQPAAEAARAGIPLTAIKQVGSRRVAIIGGEEIGIGGRYQDARVVRITDREVVLRRAGETTVHKLYPQVDKRPRGN